MPFIRAKLYRKRGYIDNPKCIHMLETLRCPALNRCPARAWHAVQTSFLLGESHFGLLCSYRIFFREKIQVISTTKQIAFHLITCCCIITSTSCVLPTDQVHPVATGLAKFSIGLVSTQYLWQSTVWGCTYTDSLLQGSFTPPWTKVSSQDHSNTNYLFWMKIERRNKFFGLVVFTDLTKVRQLVFEKYKSRK